MSRDDFIRASQTLTDDQKRAISSLKRAITACKKAKLVFHNPLETLMWFNGNIVDYITVEDLVQPYDACDLHATDVEAGSLILPWSGSADDGHMHWVVPTEKGQSIYDDEEHLSGEE